MGWQWNACLLFVNFTLVQALRLCTGPTVYRGSRGIALLFLDHGTRRGWGVSVTPRPLFTPGKVPVPIVQEAGWTPGPVWTGAENLSSTGIRSPDRPARSQSLYGLSYPAHCLFFYPCICAFCPLIWESRGFVPGRQWIGIWPGTSWPNTTVFSLTSYSRPRMNKYFKQVFNRSSQYILCVYLTTWGLATLFLIQILWFCFVFAPPRLPKNL